jgi:hypothetical protein
VAVIDVVVLDVTERIGISVSAMDEVSDVAVVVNTVADVVVGVVLVLVLTVVVSVTVVDAVVIVAV